VFTFRLHGNNEQEKNMAWLDGSDPGVYCLCLIYLPCCSFFSVSDHRHSYWRTVRKSYATTKNNELFYRKEPQSVNVIHNCTQHNDRAVNGSENTHVPVPHVSSCSV
uniref:Uncharacterized protein n=1 Tax=Cynoglossus semilaevis TaxID=244447 RepID=A0A3P8VLB5_CYNSE